MALDTLYNINVASPVQITRELYSNVGSGINQVGDVKRLFLPSTDFEIWDSAVGGTQLTEGVDYQLADLDSFYSQNADFGLSGQDVYAGYQILTPAYQTGNIYITYKIIISYTDADNINSIRAAITNNIKYLVFADSPYTILDSDGYGKFICDTTSGSIVINTPTLADNQNRVIEIIHQTGTNVVDIAGEGTEKIDELDNILLPKPSDRIKILGTASRWEIVEENISCQLRLNTFAGYGAIDSQIVQFLNIVENTGNMFSENHVSGYNSSNEGLEITINKSGKYSFTFTTRTSAASANYCGLSINSTQLTIFVTSITVSDVLAYDDGLPSSSGIGSASWAGRLNVGDVIRAHAGGSAISASSPIHFSASYTGV